MTAYIVRRLLWVVVLLFLVSALTFVIFYTLPSADPAQRAGGQEPEPAADRIDPRRPRARSARLRAVRRVHEEPRAALRLRLQLPEQLGRQDADLLARARDDLADDRRRDPLDADGDLGGDPLRGAAPVEARPRRDGRLADRDLGAGLLARPGDALSVRVRHRQVQDLQGRQQLRSVHRRSRRVWFQSLMLPWFVLAVSFAAFYARLLRANLSEVMEEDYIRTARAKGLSERRVVSTPRHAQRGHTDRDRARPRHRHPARRRDPHRERVQHPRGRPAGVRLDPARRPAGDPGHGACWARSSSSSPTWSLTSPTPSSTRGCATNERRCSRSRTCTSTSRPTTASSRRSTVSR